MGTVIKGFVGTLVAAVVLWLVLVIYTDHVRLVETHQRVTDLWNFVRQQQAATARPAPALPPDPPTTKNR